MFDDLLRDIRLAYPEKTIPGASFLFDGPRYQQDPEMADLAALIEGATWGDLTTRDCVPVSESLCLFSAQAVPIVLPALLCNGIVVHSGDQYHIASWTLYALCGTSASNKFNKDHTLDSGALNWRQMKCIADWILCLASLGFPPCDSINSLLSGAVEYYSSGSR